MLCDADRVLANTFVFDNPWDMEMTHEVVTFPSAIDWNYMPGIDREWTFMLSRFAFLDNLRAARTITGEKRYTDKGEALIRDFYERNPLTNERKMLSWRTLDTAIRVHHVLSFPLEDETLKKTFISASATYLDAVDSPFLRISNWGTIGFAYLAEASLFLADEALFDRTILKLLDNLQASVLPCGMQAEQSPMYHAEVLFALLDLIRAAEVEGHALPSTIRDTATRMLLASLAGCKGNRHQVMEADSDDTDLSTLFSYGSLVLADGRFKTFGEPELDARFSPSEQLLYSALIPLPPPFISTSLFSSGNTYLRSGWGDDDLFVHFKTGHIGSGHGHGDLLHFDLAKGKSDILIDSGRYTYTDTKERFDLKSGKAHNTILLDDEDFIASSDSWTFTKIPTYIPPIFHEGHIGTYAMGENLSYNGAVIRREIITLGKDAMVLLDTVISDKKHKTSRYFHFDNTNIPTLHDGYGQYNDTRLWFGNEETPVLEKTLLSRHYNEMEEKMTLRLDGSSDAVLWSVITFSKDASIHVGDVRNMTSGYEIEGVTLDITTNGKDTTIILIPGPTPGKATRFGNSTHNGFGRIMLFQEGQYDALII